MEGENLWEGSLAKKKKKKKKGENNVSGPKKSHKEEKRVRMFQLGTATEERNNLSPRAMKNTKRTRGGCMFLIFKASDRQKKKHRCVGCRHPRKILKIQ